MPTSPDVPAGAPSNASPELDTSSYAANNPAGSRIPSRATSPMAPVDSSATVRSTPRASSTSANARSPRASTSSGSRDDVPSASRASSSRTPGQRSNRSNRISGFFSNLKPRPQTMPPAPIVEAPQPAPPPPPAPTPPPPKQKPRAPTVPAEPLPPSLDAPSLRDLGLSLNVLTPSLIPSNYATPPTSGTFMQPHFLLLCHNQGLDVLPLVGPPAPKAYGLIRRVPFKSVVVMEERGVLVAIAGRRESVRVYALEEVRKAVEWRMDVEVQREVEQARKEEEESKGRVSMSTELKAKLEPRAPTLAPIRTPKPPHRTPPPNYSSLQIPTVAVQSHSDSPHPPNSSDAAIPPQPTSPGAPSLAEPTRPVRDRGASVSSMVQTRMLVGNDPSLVNSLGGTQEEKAEWIEGAEASDDEALVAAGPSGSAALDERTSSMPTTSSTPFVPSAAGDIPEVAEDGSDEGTDPRSPRESVEDLQTQAVPAQGNTPNSSPPASASVDPATQTRRRRPSSLQLRPPDANITVRPATPDATPPASPVPTVFSLQRSLSQAPTSPTSSAPPARRPRQNERITFAQALMESRLPEAQPAANLPRRGSSTTYDPTADAGDEADEDPDPEDNNSTIDDHGSSPTTPRPPPVPSVIPPNTNVTQNRSLTPSGGRRASSTTLDSHVSNRSRRRWSFLGGPPAASSERLPARTNGTNPVPSTNTASSSRNSSQDFVFVPESSAVPNGGPRSAPPRPRTPPSGPARRSPSMPSTPTSRSRTPSAAQGPSTAPIPGGGRGLQRTSSHPGLGTSSSNQQGPRSAGPNGHAYGHSPSQSSPSIPTPTHSGDARRTPTSGRRFLPKFLNALRSNGDSSGNGHNSRRSPHHRAHHHDRRHPNGGYASNASGGMLDGSSDTETDGPSASYASGSPLPTPFLGGMDGLEPGQDGLLGPAGPPKMEYVKLPGTQKSLMIKAVETAKKSFLAILCGENGEKVELFAGTYRTALGLSRTFILPDSPRSLELQLQGDDLVELFLMFNQNVFGLEPATVRVREVRIGRAERRARRRAAARENELLGGEGTGEGRDGMMSLDSDVRDTQVITTVMSAGDEDGVDSPNVMTPVHGPSTSIANGTAVRGAVAPAVTQSAPTSRPASPAPTPTPAAQRPSSPRPVSPGPAQSATASSSQPAGESSKPSLFPYTTFQQLSFAPNFPLAVIADEYIIPPTYLDFDAYQKEHEAGLDITEISTPVPPAASIPNGESSEAEPASTAEATTTTPTTTDVPASEDASIPKEPPGLPKPPPRWVYRDPKGILRGPWEADVMQNWLRDGYLPSTLPLRRETETTFVTLKELLEAHGDNDNVFFTDPAAPSPAATTSTQPATSVTSTSTSTSSSTPTPASAPTVLSPWIPVPNTLLPPTSLLQQPRYFGPPALFFTTRGGHSTAIVDARGRSVLKGRVMWSTDETDDSPLAGPGPTPVLGDVKRIEAFDTRGSRAVVVALRQGGLEAVDMGDALFQPGDESRPHLPMFISPASSTGRRKNWTWHLGSAVEDISSRFAQTRLGRRTGPSLLPNPNASTGNGHALSPGSSSNAHGVRRSASARRVRRDEDRSGPAPPSVPPLANALSPDEDILFLGRNRDRVYMCERNADSFRILQLSALE
ncbi:hypothetical protein DL93DRAFT_2136935 [Clavulina sp. PMI_390]|nr:hypothetical protein DL93DRAFT_2136935 [Clavulina sp. PMI_390]